MDGVEVFGNYCRGDSPFGVEYYEIWNEPDAGACTQRINVGDYVNLVEVVVPEIKRRYPDDAEYYYGYPDLVQEIKTRAYASGFTRDFT